MDQDEKIYRELQRHLNRQAVGFPATRSGADIKLLKHIFSPRDAEMATCLNPIVAKAGGLQSQEEHLSKQKLKLLPAKRGRLRVKS